MEEMNDRRIKSTLVEEDIVNCNPAPVVISLGDISESVMNVQELTKDEFPNDITSMRTKDINEALHELSSDYEDTGSKQFPNFYMGNTSETNRSQKNSSTIFENAVKALKHLFSPGKTHGIFTRSSAHMDVNYAEATVMKKDIMEKNLFFHEPASDGFNRPASTTFNLSCSEILLNHNQCLIDEEINNSDVKNTGTVETHDSTNDSYTTTVSRMDDSFQSTVTHFDDYTQNEAQKSSVSSSNTENNSISDDSLNETLDANDNTLDDTIKKNTSGTSLVNNNLNDTFEKTLDDTSNPGIQSVNLNFVEMNRENLREIADSKQGTDVCEIEPLLGNLRNGIQGPELTSEKTAKDLMCADDEENLKNNTSSVMLCNSYSPEGLNCTDSLPTTVASENKYIQKTKKITEDSNVISSAMPYIDVTYDNTPDNNSSTVSQTDVVFSGKVEVAPFEKTLAQQSYTILEKNFSTSTVVVSKGELNNTCDNLVVDDCITYSPSIGTSASIVFDNSNLQDIENGNSVTVLGIQTEEGGRPSPKNQVETVDRMNAVKHCGAIIPTESPPQPEMLENDEINFVADTLSQTNCPKETDYASHQLDSVLPGQCTGGVNQPAFEPVSLSSILLDSKCGIQARTLSEELRAAETSIPLASQKSYTVLHNLNPDLNRPIVFHNKHDIKGGELNNVILGNDASHVSEFTDNNCTETVDVINGTGIITPSCNVVGVIPRLLTVPFEKSDCSKDIDSGNFHEANMDLAIQMENLEFQEISKTDSADLKGVNVFATLESKSTSDSYTIIKSEIEVDHSKYSKSLRESASVKSSDLTDKIPASDEAGTVENLVLLALPSSELGDLITQNRCGDLLCENSRETTEDLMERKLGEEFGLEVKEKAVVRAVSSECSLSKRLTSSCSDISSDIDPNGIIEETRSVTAFNMCDSDSDTGKTVTGIYFSLNSNNFANRNKSLSMPTSSVTIPDKKKSPKSSNADNLIVDLENLRTNDSLKADQGTKPLTKHLDMEIPSNPFKGKGDFFPAGDEAGAHEKFNECPTDQILSNDKELTQFITEQFTAIDIEKICSVVDDIPELNLSKNIVLASQQFDESFQERISNENGTSRNTNCFVRNNDTTLSSACLDFLDSIKGKPSGRDYSRDSLYIKFDPLVQSGRVTELVDISEGDKENLIVSPVSKNNTLEPLIPATPLKQTCNAVSPLSPLTPTSQKNESKLSTEKLNKLRELQNEIFRLREFYLQREELDKEKMNNYENEIAKLTGKVCVLEGKLKESEEREKLLVKKLSSQNESMDRLKKIVEEYVGYISKLTGQMETMRMESQREILLLKEERDYYMNHLQSTEQAFSDVHSKYEKGKKAVEVYKKNEETYKTNIEFLKEKVEMYNLKVKELKENAAKEVNDMYAKMNELKTSHSQEISRFKAQLRKTELKVQTVQEALEQKIKENQELAGICDELIEGKK